MRTGVCRVVIIFASRWPSSAAGVVISARGANTRLRRRHRKTGRHPSVDEDRRYALGFATLPPVKELSCVPTTPQLTAMLFRPVTAAQSSPSRRTEPTWWPELIVVAVWALARIWSAVLVQVKEQHDPCPLRQPGRQRRRAHRPGQLGAGPQQASAPLHSRAGRVLSQRGDCPALPHNVTGDADNQPDGKNNSRYDGDELADKRKRRTAVD